MHHVLCVHGILIHPQITVIMLIFDGIGAN